MKHASIGFLTLPTVALGHWPVADAQLKGDKERLCVDMMDLRDKCLIKSQLCAQREVRKIWWRGSQG